MWGVCDGCENNTYLYECADCGANVCKKRCLKRDDNGYEQEVKKCIGCGMIVCNNCIRVNYFILGRSFQGECLDCIEEREVSQDEQEDNDPSYFVDEDCL